MEKFLNNSIVAQYPGFFSLLGVLGLIFYAVGPIVFPDAPIRQPELLPVYTLMMGLGQLLKKEEDTNDAKDKPQDKSE